MASNDSDGGNNIALQEIFLFTLRERLSEFKVVVCNNNTFPIYNFILGMQFM